MSLYTELRTKVIGAYAGVTSGAALAIRRHPHLHGLQMVILPMTI
jgi:hypothetical protein